MAYGDDFLNMMQPKKGDIKINLPVTFDYNGGGQTYNRTRLIWALLLGVIGFLVGVGVIFSSKGYAFVNLLLGLSIMVVVSLIVRFPILKEHIVRNDMVKLLDSDYKYSTESFWGIYAIDDVFPYYAHLRNGKTALFVRFEKDVILGRDKDSEYEHYEAIGDAYNLAGSYNMGLCYIDYMGLIGNDDRIDECFNSLADIESESMLDIMTRVYTNLQTKMSKMYSTFDVYVFTFKNSEATFRYQIDNVFACMMEANYVDCSILTPREIRDLCKEVVPEHEFSVSDACAASVGRDRKAAVIPISVRKASGKYEKLNKTVEEKREDSRKAKEAEIARKQSKGKKGLNPDKLEEEKFDIF